MRNKLYLTALATMCSISMFAQTSNTGRFNWFPNQGNVGIGTRAPSKDLEVIGDLNVTGTTTSNSVQTTTLQSGTFLNLNNAIINGRLGVGGVPNPTEALDVLGNLKLSGNITAQGVNFQTLTANAGTFGSLTVNQNVNVGGNLILTNNLSALGITSTSLNTQTLIAGVATFSENATFAKNISVGGKLGIGVAQPIEVLEVGGNMKSTGSLLSQSLTTGAAQLTSLSVSQNSSFTGPTSFGSKVSIGNDLALTGKLGVGVASPTESLDVNGNVKLTGAISASSANINQGTFAQGLTAGNTSVNGTLNVTGQSTLAGATIGGTTTANDVQINGALNAKNISMSDLTTSGNATVGQNLNVAGKVGIGLTPTESLEVSGNIRSSQGLISNSITSGTGSFSGDVHGSQNLIVDGQVAIGKQSAAYTLDVNGTVNATSVLVNGQPINPTSATNFTIDQTLTVNGNTKLGVTQITGQLASNAISATSLTTTGSVSAGQGLSVTGTGTFFNDITVTGSANIGNALTVNGTLTAGNLAMTSITASGDVRGQNLYATGAGQVATDLSVGGNLTAGVITGSDFRKTDGTPFINLDNTVISQTLAVGITRQVPANYAMAVGGNIIATGIDIKIPQKWPDYVFTDGHKLLSIEEVNRYIQEHGHLPGVLSAKEMQAKENYSVSEMDSKLLEKIEELTLYIIELKKEIDQLKKN
ncbi:MAG TPA: hypothetical protein VL728_05275 [Cyclobacteriaceae bacterium]|nr:hypothetical protein [Cyclobacteriaceae bacterium]